MMCRSSHFSVSYRPASQIVTLPPPYSPAAMLPENDAYSSGWSSVGTASRFGPRRGGGPLGRRPALQDAVALEPQIPVHPLPRAPARRVVLLDDEGVVVPAGQRSAR